MASSADPAPAAQEKSSRAGRTLWLWVGGAFLFLVLLWTAMVFAARHADTRTVPLQGKETRR